MSRPAALARFQRDLGYRFGDPALLEMALTHRSWSHEQGDREHYERVEFLGDAVLGLLTAEWLYARHPELAEGELSKLKSYLVSEVVLAERAERLGLGEVLQLGVGEERSGGRGKRSLLADALEAILGAVFLDGGLDSARGLAALWLQSALQDQEGELGPLAVADAKTTLQELAQGRGLDLPEYHHVAEEGPDHCKRFFVECWVGGEVRGRGAGATKKEAEQEAARSAVDALADGAAAGTTRDRKGSADDEEGTGD